MSIARSRSLRRIPAARLLLLALTSLLLLRTRLAVSLLPWRRFVARLDPPAGRWLSRFDARELEWAVRAASRLVPRTTCLTQALTLNHLLHRAGCASRVRIGVARRSGRFAAHAWVEHGGVPLLSRPDEIEPYTAFLTWPPARPDLCQ